MQVFRKDIRIDGGTQMRAGLDNAIVTQYCEEMKDGAKFPPLVVFFDGKHYWLADGFHRYFAAKVAGINRGMDCEVRNGTQRDAVLFAASANSSHGLRRTNADKRHSVVALLEDSEWVQWSDRKIAEVCGVNNATVSRYRNELLQNNSSGLPITTKGRDGRTRKRPARRRRPALPNPDDIPGPEVEPETPSRCKPLTLEEAYKKAIRCAASEAVKTIKALIAEHVSLMSVDEKLSIVDMLDCDEEIARRRQEVKVAT